MVNSLSFNRARVSSYACSLKNTDKDYLAPVENEREWKEARCPIFMEHPHNVVLLLCSSRDKGCLPYNCYISYSNSNHLDQFCKLLSGTQSQVQQGGSTILGMIPRAKSGTTFIRNNWFCWRKATRACLSFLPKID